MSYPKNLAYMVSKLAGYSTQVVKVRVNGTNSAVGGDVVSFDLPYNAIVDMDSLRFFFKLSTTGFGDIRHAEGIIRQIFVEAGGQVISNGCDGTHLLWNTLNDLQAGDKQTARQLFQKSTGLTAAPAAALSSVQCYVSNILGFPMSVKPQFIDTSLFPSGSIRISFRLNPHSAVIAGAATAYSLSDMYLLVRTVDIQDGLYYQVLNEKLKSGAIEIPFTNIYSFNSGTIGTLSDSTLRFSLSSQSVDMLLGIATNIDSQTVEGTNTKNATTYVRGASAPQVQWTVNNVPHPSYGLMSSADAHSETLTSLGLLQDAVGAMNPDMTTQALWESNFFASAYRLNHPDGDSDSRLVSGVNALGTNGIGEFRVVSSGTANRVLWVYVFTTAVLRLGAGRTMAITY